MPGCSTVVKRLFNGGFEDGLIGWTTTGDTDYTDAGLVRGDAEAARTGTGSLRTGPVAVGFLSQTCDTTAGRPHQLSFWLRGGYDGNEYQFAVKLDPAPLALQEGVLGPNGTVLNITGVDEFGWTRHAVMFVPSSAQTTVQFASQHNLGYFFVDDVSLTSGKWWATGAG